MRFWLVVVLLSGVFTAGAQPRLQKQNGTKRGYIEVLSILSSRLNIKLHYHDFHNSLYETKPIKSVVITDTSYFSRNIADSDFYDFDLSIDSNVYNNGWPTLTVSTFHNMHERDSTTSVLIRY